MSHCVAHDRRVWRKGTPEEACHGKIGDAGVVYAALPSDQPVKALSHWLRVKVKRACSETAVGPPVKFAGARIGNYRS